LAEVLIFSVQFLLGNLQRIKGVSIWPRDRTEEVKDRIKKGMDEVNDGDGVVILTDIFGGTPTNLSLSFYGLDIPHSFDARMNLENGSISIYQNQDT